MREVSAFRVEAAVLRAVSESLLTRVATDPTRGAVAIVKERIRLYDRAFASAGTAAVVCRARVRLFAALCPIVGIASWAIATRNFG